MRTQNNGQSIASQIIHRGVNVMVVTNNMLVYDGLHCRDLLFQLDGAKRWNHSVNSQTHQAGAFEDAQIRISSNQSHSVRASVALWRTLRLCQYVRPCTPCRVWREGECSVWKLPFSRVIQSTINGAAHQP
jgi:hypothetical protein